jgi:hypothetical protein
MSKTGKASSMTREIFLYLKNDQTILLTGTLTVEGDRTQRPTGCTRILRHLVHNIVRSSSELLVLYKGE